MQLTLPFVKFNLTSAEIRRLVQFRMQNFAIYQRAREDRRRAAESRRKKRLEILTRVAS